MSNNYFKVIIFSLTMANVMIIVFIFSSYPEHNKIPYIDLPEEINQANRGDTLIVIHSNKDTISLGFLNH